MSLSLNLYDMFFEWPSTDAQEVIVTGSFDDWSGTRHLNKTARGFVGTVKVPYGDKLKYKFIVDGQWKTLKDQPIERDAAGIENNVFQTPPHPSGQKAEPRPGSRQGKEKAPAARIRMVLLPLNSTEQAGVASTPIEPTLDFVLPPARLPNVTATSTVPAAKEEAPAPPAEVGVVVEEPKVQPVVKESVTPDSTARAKLVFVRLNSLEHNTVGSTPIEHPPDFVLPPPRRRARAGSAPLLGSRKAPSPQVEEETPSRFLRLNSKEHNTVGSTPIEYPPDYVLPPSPRARAKTGSRAVTPIVTTRDLAPEEDFPHPFVRLNSMEHNTVGRTTVLHPPDYVLPPSPRSLGRKGGRSMLHKEVPVASTSKLAALFMPLNATEHNTVGSTTVVSPPGFVLPPSPRSLGKAASKSVRASSLESTRTPVPVASGAATVQTSAPKILKLATAFVPLNSTEHNTVTTASVQHPPDFVLPPSPRSLGKSAARSIPAALKEEEAPVPKASAVFVQPQKEATTKPEEKKVSASKTLKLATTFVPLNSTEHNTVGSASVEHPPDFVMPPSPRKVTKATSATSFPILSPPKPASVPVPTPAPAAAAAAAPSTPPPTVREKVAPVAKSEVAAPPVPNGNSVVAAAVPAARTNAPASPAKSNKVSAPPPTSKALILFRRTSTMFNTPAAVVPKKKKRSSSIMGKIKTIFNDKERQPLVLGKESE